MPRKWIVTDEQVVEACKREARTIDELFMVQGHARAPVHEGRAHRGGAHGERARRTGSTWPDIDKGSKSERNVDAEDSTSCAVVRLRAKENDVAFQTLASHDDLARLARQATTTTWTCCADGGARSWARSFWDLLEGRLSLSLAAGEPVVERREG